MQRCRDEGISPELEAEIEAASFELNQLTEKLAQDRIDAEYEVMQVGPS